MKCEICGMYETFRTYKGFEMCIRCYHTNTVGTHGTESKSTNWDKENLIFNKKKYKK